MTVSDADRDAAFIMLLRLEWDHLDCPECYATRDRTERRAIPGVPIEEAYAVEFVPVMVHDAGCAVGTICDRLRAAGYRAP